MIEIRHLRYFVAVAEELHFGRAAERLDMAQSPLSQQIRQLERQLGVPLIERGHRVVGLTDAGRVFLGAAKDVLADLDEASRVARRAHRGEVGTLRIGYVREVTAEVLPLSLKAAKDRYSDIEFDLREGTTGVLVDALKRRRVDVAFVRAARVIEDVEYEELSQEPLFVIFPPDRSYREPLNLADLAGEKFVQPTHEAAQGLRRDIESACAAAGFNPDISREASSLTTVPLLVAGGAGVALLPASVVQGHPVPGVQFARLDDAPVTSAGVAWRRGESSRLVANFLACTRQVVHGAG